MHFNEFSPVSKQAWLTKIERDLKGKPLEELLWQLREDWTISPFPHADDLEALPSPISLGKSNNAWEIGEEIVVTDAKAANLLSLNALNGGATALLFHLPKDFGAKHFSTLLKDIQLEWISTHFTGGAIADFVGYLKTTNFDLRKLKGSWRNANETTSELPHFIFHAISGAPYLIDTSQSIEELSQLLQDFNQQLQQIEQHQQTPFIVTIAIGKSYFVNIAKVRALKLLCTHLLTAYNTNLPYQIEAYIPTTTYSEDANQNNIQISTQALSAVIAGVDRLFIAPAEQQGSDFSRRIARNVQHLLQLESHLDHVVDPSAGSYYIENLTQEIAERAWQHFVAHTES